jgi:ferredoxin
MNFNKIYKPTNNFLKMPIKIDYSKCCWKDGKCTSCGCGGGKVCIGCVEACPVSALSRKKVL